MTRAEISVVPPVANGTTMRTGLRRADSLSCARGCRRHSDAVAQMAAAAAADGRACGPMPAASADPVKAAVWFHCSSRSAPGGGSVRRRPGWIVEQARTRDAAGLVSGACPRSWTRKKPGRTRSRLVPTVQSSGRDQRGRETHRESPPAEGRFNVAVQCGGPTRGSARRFQRRGQRIDGCEDPAVSREAETT